MCESQNYHLQTWLKNKIATLPLEQQLTLKGLKMCARNVLPSNITPSGQSGVFLLSNGNGDSRFFGHITCKNTWCCPVCTARVMEKRRQRIGAALDALGDKLFAFSVTFTIPHLRFQSCHEVTDLLYETWKRFNSMKSLKGKRAKTQFVEPVQQFFSKIHHFVRVGEYTWGKNGWHPHFHMIFWTDFESAKSIAELKPKLQKTWNNEFANVAKGYWKRNNLDRDINKFIDCINHAALKGTSESVNFSINPDGSLFRVKSSDYVSGWGGDSEATGNRQKKASHADHYTQWQILELAESDEFFANLYIEFCLETSKHVHQRTAFSKNLKKIIDDYINKVGYESILKKKSIECQAFRVVCWFSREQWSKLCSKSHSVLSNILYLAKFATYNSEKEMILLDYIISEIGEVYLPDSNHLSKLVEDMFNPNKKAA